MPVRYDGSPAVLVVPAGRWATPRSPTCSCAAAPARPLGRRCPHPDAAPTLGTGMPLAYDRLDRSVHRSRRAHPCPTPRNVIIIGSGPAGYTAAVYAARASLHPLVFEGSVTAGGALMNTTEVENFPGFRDGIMGPALMDEMRAQAERFGAELVPDDVVEVDLTGDVKIVKTATDTYTARSVILATGSGYRKLGLPREEELSGRGVSWCATCDGFFFREQAHRRRRRRRLRDRGGHLPDPVRLEGLR